MIGIKRNFIPANKKEYDILLKIQKEVCDSAFMDQFRFNLVAETFDIFTVVVKFMDGLHSMLVRNDVTLVNIGDLLIFEKTMRERATAEKSGNINCMIYLGQVGLDLIANGIEGFSDAIEDDIDLRRQMLDAAKLAVKGLEDYNIRGLSPEDVYHIVIAFFTYMILVVDEASKNENVDERDFKIEIGVSNLSYFRVGFSRVGGTVLTFNPGPDLTTSVKSDAMTE